MRGAILVDKWSLLRPALAAPQQAQRCARSPGLASSLCPHWGLPSRFAKPAASTVIYREGSWTLRGGEVTMSTARWPRLVPAASCRKLRRAAWPGAYPAASRLPARWPAAGAGCRPGPCCVCCAGCQHSASRTAQAGRGRQGAWAGGPRGGHTAPGVPPATVAKGLGYELSTNWQAHTTGRQGCVPGQAASRCQQQLPRRARPPPSAACAAAVPRPRTWSRASSES